MSEIDGLWTSEGRSEPRKHLEFLPDSWWSVSQIRISNSAPADTQIRPRWPQKLNDRLLGPSPFRLVVNKGSKTRLTPPGPGLRVPPN
jgi:hypothetical protein